MGKSIVYDHDMPAFKELMLKGFDDIILEFMDVPHVQKYVMDRIYFPDPKFIPSVWPEIPWVKECRERVARSMDKATAPLDVYLGFFRKYEDFINIDIPAYVDEKVKVIRKDPSLRKSSVL